MQKMFFCSLLILLCSCIVSPRQSPADRDGGTLFSQSVAESLNGHETSPGMKGVDLSALSPSGEAGYLFSEMTNTVNADCRARYPKLYLFENETVQNKLNHVIETTVNQFFKIDSDYINCQNTIDYEIKYYNNELISILFQSYQFYEGAVRGNTTCFAVNAFLDDGKTIQLDTVYRVDDAFLKKVMTPVYCSHPDYAAEFYDDVMPGEAFIETFYFTQHNLGVIINIPMAGNTHLHYQIPYHELQPWFIG